MNKLTGIATDASVVGKDLAACHFEKPTLDIITFCTSSQDTPCSVSKLTENFSKSILSVASKFSEAIGELKGFPSADTDEFESQMTSIGSAIGTTS